MQNQAQINAALDGAILAIDLDALTTETYPSAIDLMIALVDDIEGGAL